jgi:hypothetical protein
MRKPIEFVNYNQTCQVIKLLLSSALQDGKFTMGKVEWDKKIETVKKSRSQSYDREIQRQRCKNLQHHE